MIDFFSIVERLKQSASMSSDKQLAGLLGLSPQDFSKRKKRGTILPLLIEYAINHKVDLNWLLTGEGERCIKKEDLAVVEPSVIDKINAIEERLSAIEKKIEDHEDRYKKGEAA